MPLTETSAKNAKPREQAFKLSDGGGLFLLVQPNGSKLWRLKYRFEGKEKLLSFGAYPDIGVAAARDKRNAAKVQLSEGCDPMKNKAQATASGTETFRVIAERWHENRKSALNTAHADRVWSRLERDVFPFLGEKPVQDITPPDVLEMVRKIEARGALDISRRAKQGVGQVFQFAIACGLASSDPTAHLRGALKPRPRVKHMSRIALSEVPFLIENLDGNQPLWRVPAHRMKMGREHLVPLSFAAAAIAKRMIQASSGDFLFPGKGPEKPISENTMIYALYRLGYHTRQTVHGFRGLASTWANEQLVEVGKPILWIRKYHEDWVEMQLAHSESNEVRGAYNAAEYLAPRRKMMQDWADFLSGGKIVNIARGKRRAA